METEISLPELESLKKHIEKAVSEYLKQQLKSIVVEYDKLFNDVITCIESEESILDLLPWYRHLQDTLNMYLAFHRGMVIYDLISKLPESVRPKVFPTLLGVRSDIPVFTYLPKECLDKLEKLLSASSYIAVVGLRKLDINRYSVGIARIVSIISRAITKNGIFIDRKSLIGLLYELKTNVDSLKYL